MRRRGAKEKRIWAISKKVATTAFVRKSSFLLALKVDPKILIIILNQNVR